MTQKLISQGAEAKIFLSNNFIIKDRTPKSYRLPELDEKIRTRRTRSEAKLLDKASKIINCPKPISENFSGGAGQQSKGGNLTKLKIPYLKGKKLSEFLNKFSLQKQKQIMKNLGKSIAKLHEANIIHGDLTTSNMILVKDEIHIIDFGLGYFNGKFEDKAVDIHLLHQALEAKHFQNWKVLFKEFLKEYKKSPDSKTVLERLKAVEKRGRYKH